MQCPYTTWVKRLSLNYFNMERIRVLNESKFERLTEAEMTQVNGGLCIRCLKRARKGPEVEVKISIKGTCSSSGNKTISNSGILTTRL